jgi:hypothetical protein
MFFLIARPPLLAVMQGGEYRMIPIRSQPYLRFGAAGARSASATARSLKRGQTPLQQLWAIIDGPYS